MKIEKKLTAKTILGNIKRLVAVHLADVLNDDKSIKTKNDGKEIPAFRIFGSATGTKVGTSDFGPWIACLGQFEAENLIALPDSDGEMPETISVSNIAILPQIVSEMTAQAIEAARGSPIEFAWEIGLRRRDDVAIGYEFTAKPLIEVKQADSLADLRARMAAQKALPKPPAPDTSKDHGKKK